MVKSLCVSLPKMSVGASSLMNTLNHRHQGKNTVIRTANITFKYILLHPFIFIKTGQGGFFGQVVHFFFEHYTAVRGDGGSAAHSFT